MILEEKEVKIRIPSDSLELLRDRIRRAGFKKTAERQLEVNQLFDYPDLRIKHSGSAVRIREYGNHRILTWKGPLQPNSRYKIREEIETEVANHEALVKILNKIGLTPVFEYSKFREKFQIRLKEEVEICLDETRVGTFLEIEGTEKDISQVIKMLKLDRSNLVQDTYAELLA